MNAANKRRLCRLMPGVLLGWCMLASAYAADWNVERLMQALAKHTEGRATFVERKYVAVLERPVESSGELSFRAPDRFEKKTVKPRPETMRLEGDVLTIERGRQTQVLSLQEYPELAGFIDSIRGTLTGDRKALERAFALKLKGDRQRWTLILTPTDSKIARAVREIDIAGSNDEVRAIDILETGGDRSSMTIESIAAR